MSGVLRSEANDRDIRGRHSGARELDRPTQLDLAQPSDLAAGCWCDQQSWAGSAGEILVLSVSGEVDLLTHPIVTAALDEAVSTGPRHLVVDVAAMGFCCVRGFSLLAGAHLAASTQGVGFVVSGLTASHDRVMTMVLPHPGPTRYPSVAAAVTALRSQDAQVPGR